MEVKAAQLRRLCDSTDYTVHGILQARILEWAALPFSRGSYQPRDRTQLCLFHRPSSRLVFDLCMKVAQSCLILCEPMELCRSENWSE